MKLNHLFIFILLSGMILGGSGCNMPALKDFPEVNEFLSLPPKSGEGGEYPAGTNPPLDETPVTFRVINPPGGENDSPLFLVLLDEVTGLALNSTVVPLEPVEAPNEAGNSEAYSVTLPIPVGSVIKYRYERQAGGIRVAEHLSDGRAVRYRMAYVTGQLEIQDVISRWTDSDYQLPTGRIQGQIIDTKSQQPLPDILICAGGAQTTSASDGSFMLEGLPPGVHLLVAYSMDGRYQIFQQGAEVADGSTTPATVSMTPAVFSNIVFVVKVPDGTPPVVPLRMAGNLLQLGDSFANLSGGVSTLAANMPVLSSLPDGRYTITISLPIGADIRYKYTLGDGFWNAERNADGAFRVRQLIVSEQAALVEDEITTWNDIQGKSMTFDLQVPADTLPKDNVTIQLNPIFGWTEPLPMWKLGDTRWAYVLYSPLNLPGELTYRYCRNYQCGSGGGQQPSGYSTAEKKVTIPSEPLTIANQITNWPDWSSSALVPGPTAENVIGRGDGYRTGFELSTGYHPSWNTLFPQAIEEIQASQANLVVLTPTWSFGYGSEDNLLPILAPVPGQDQYWSQTVQWVEEAQNAGLHTALKPVPNFPTTSSEWWSAAERNQNWWQVWFEQYRSFVIHFADLAESTNSETLLLGGGWITPALPGGALADGTGSQVPEDAAQRWQELIGEVRAHYHGQLGWVLPADGIANPPGVLDLVDRIYLELTVEPGSTIESRLGMDLNTWMDNALQPFQFQAAKPLLLAVACPSTPDLQAQLSCYQVILQAVNGRDWISGFISQGYYLPAASQDRSSSVHGKPAEKYLGTWFPAMSE